jgi:two-component system response regulator DesR
MRILLADQELRIRKAMGLLLARMPEHELIAEVTSAADVLPSVNRIHPDLILLDLDLPGLNLQAMVTQLRRQTGKVIIVGMSGKPEHIRDKDLAGLDDFISKNEPADKVLTILQKWSTSQQTTQTHDQL